MSACLLCLSAQARDISYVDDAFGYQTIDSCSASYLNIDAQATTLNLVASGSDPASDEGAAVLNLPLTHEFYNVSHDQVVISSNGYLAFAEDLTQENGADFSNDCLFPSVPDNQPQSNQRIMAYHDDLMADTSGAIQWAHFDQCPVLSNGQACTVIEWQNWRLNQTAGAFSFQIILLYNPAKIVLQYDNRVPVPASASVGFQHAGLFSGWVMACNQSQLVLANSSHCFDNPYIFDDDFE